jgi:hypothetical protein
MLNMLKLNKLKIFHMKIQEMKTVFGVGESREDLASQVDSFTQLFRSLVASVLMSHFWASLTFEGRLCGSHRSSLASGHFDLLGTLVKITSGHLVYFTN